jgi:hypothetical protein
MKLDLPANESSNLKASFTRPRSRIEVIENIIKAVRLNVFEQRANYFDADLLALVTGSDQIRYTAGYHSDGTYHLHTDSDKTAGFSASYGTDLSPVTDPRLTRSFGVRVRPFKKKSGETGTLVRVSCNMHFPDLAWERVIQLFTGKPRDLGLIQIIDGILPPPTHNMGNRNTFHEMQSLPRSIGASASWYADGTLRGLAMTIGLAQ